jgi:hypothetical protein
VKANVHNRRAVIRIVPISASNAAFLRVMAPSMDVGGVGAQLWFLCLLAILKRIVSWRELIVGTASFRIE